MVVRGRAPARTGREIPGTYTVVQRVEKGLLVPYGRPTPTATGAASAGLPAGQELPADVARVERKPPVSVDSEQLHRLIKRFLRCYPGFGRPGLRRHGAALYSMLGQIGGSVSLEGMLDRGGRRMAPLSMPGRPGRMLVPHIEATPTAARVVNPEHNLRIGHDTRNENVAGERDTRDRALPANRRVAGDLMSWLGVGFNSGMSIEAIAAKVIGDRDEHKAWQSGNAYEVEVDLEFRVWVDEVDTRSQGEPVTHRTRYQRKAPGRAVITLFKSDVEHFLGDQRAARPHGDHS